ncbi:hypothetical protein [Streptomyces sp. NPDC086989]|uniref:hypothetical protein n=1 Tax=Streptomyces sp. NPDC086989 TaxID=3365764 RepID=UPI0038098365
MTVIATYPTRAGHVVEVHQNAIGGYSDHCTGCDTRDFSDDIPAAEAEAAMCRGAEYHARHCERLNVGPFTPTPTDMEASHYGFLVASLDPDYADGHLIAIGPDLTARRAVAAFHAYMRTELDDYSRTLLVEEMRVGSLVVQIAPTRFIRGRYSWSATPGYPGGAPAAWLIAPGLLY